MSNSSLKKLQLKEPDNRVMLSTPIAWLAKNEEFGSRAYNALKMLDLKTTEDILTIDMASLHNLPNVGAGTVAEIMAFMLRYKNLKEVSGHEQSPLAVAEQMIKKEFSKHLENICSFAKTLPTPVQVIIELSNTGAPNIMVAPLDNPKQLLVEAKQTEIEELHIKPGKRILDIYTPEGNLMREKFAYQTFVNFIEQIGEQNILPLSIVAKDDIPLLTEKPVPHASSKKNSNGWYVTTGINNDIKASIVNLIAEKLGLYYRAESYLVSKEPDELLS